MITNEYRVVDYGDRCEIKLIVFKGKTFEVHDISMYGESMDELRARAFEVMLAMSKPVIKNDGGVKTAFGLLGKNNEK